MGKKKSKEVGGTTKTEALPSTSKDIFKTLFGDVAEQNALSSLFSDDNPFRRKPQNLTFESSRPAESPNNVGSGNQDRTELNKKKRGKGIKSDFDSDSEVEGAKKIKKSKKVRSSDLGSQLGVEPKEDNVKNTDKGDELNVLEKEKHSKKRKRDEIEREYEVRKYGAENEEERPKGQVVGNKRKTLDNAAEMMVSKEGFDDESKLLRTIFVGNLPLKVKKKKLLKEFKQFGEVESVRIRSVPISDTKTPRKGAILSKKINDAVDCVHAYIVFTSEESAQASLVHNLAVIEGNHIRVDRACPPRKKLKGESATLYDTKRTVFVGNLPFDVKDEELYMLFSGIPNLKSSIEAIRVIRDPNNSVGKGIAYVLLKTKEAVSSVLRRRSLKLRDRELRLSHAKSNPTTPSAKPNSKTAPAANPPSNKSAANPRSFSGSEDKPKRKLNMNYQGVKASKNDSGKKSKHEFVEMQNERRVKRPAVAARKAKAKSQKSVAPKQSGVKRKLDNSTPESSQFRKKVRKGTM